ncbi:expressed protein [Dictyostelium purpureum]|uniref:Expressed protein n=1 Tax=Dictyostelium purpureum TaxID=5786 RepID=F0ZC94_DICPU|nr:uncharacterized protein DICPUDRAFT_91433 [Dictyostelium purpureum]EGC38482.1 expressed protein [Dictyostelium purpureum]|eukprot:XP_003285040.1 expressed protein [Dictyostelium purpureum]
MDQTEQQLPPELIKKLQNKCTRCNGLPSHKHDQKRWFCKPCNKPFTPGKHFNLNTSNLSLTNLFNNLSSNLNNMKNSTTIVVNNSPSSSSPSPSLSTSPLSSSSSVPTPIFSSTDHQWNNNYNNQTFQHHSHFDYLNNNQANVVTAQLYK